MTMYETSEQRTCMPQPLPRKSSQAERPPKSTLTLHPPSLQYNTVIPRVCRRQKEGQRKIGEKGESIPINERFPS